ncbi:protein U8 [Suid betaherpesvirus 2]|uniref:Protein U8 n=1 Tax=Suid betaherpesvirus 2 TaxID=1608255 RepID=U3GTB4_9BETA|nr:protein U8 [Suid betaherpesvirus 2]AGT99207.1 protein U8 [Suid betaherpesvirus 2]
MATATQFSQIELAQFTTLCCRADFQGLSEYLVKFHNWCFSIPSSSGKWFRITNGVDIAGYTLDNYKQFQYNYLGRWEGMQVIGAIQDDGYELPVMCGENLGIYLHKPSNDCIYLMADNINLFYKIGFYRIEAEDDDVSSKVDAPVQFRRFEDLVREDALRLITNTNVKQFKKFHTNYTVKHKFVNCLLDYEPLSRCRSLYEVKEYVECNIGFELPVIWPSSYVVRITDLQHADLTSKAISCFHSACEQHHENVEVIGRVKRANSTESRFYSLLLIGESGVIYLFGSLHRNFDEMATNLHAFVRHGLSREIFDFGYDNIGLVAKSFGSVSTIGTTLVPRNAMLQGHLRKYLGSLPYSSHAYHVIDLCISLQVWSKRRAGSASYIGVMWKT